MKNLIRDTMEWQRAAFADSTERTVLAHLREEVEELTDAVVFHHEHEHVSEEAADVLLLLIALCDKMGIDLLEEARDKLAKNKARTWKKAPGGYSKHVEPPG